MGSSAAATFARLPELLASLVHYIQSSKHLGTLRLVSKNFHDAATPVLFSAAAPISSANYEAGALAGLTELVKRNLVGYVRSLTLRHVDSQWALAANSAIRELLAEMPLLESFDCSCPMLPETISALHRSCPGLKALSFDFERMEEDVLELSNERPDDKVLRARELFTMPDLAIFSHLEKLSLLNVYGDLHQWRGQVARLLQKSPNLNSLALSLSVDAIWRFSDDDSNQYRNWFESLCETYAEGGGSPLPIRSLHCGTAIFPPNSADLEQLLHLGHLEEVSVENEAIWVGNSGPRRIYIGGNEFSGEFDTFVNAPNLQRLSVRTYARNVHRAFCYMDDPSGARQIALSTQTMNEGYEPAMLLRPHDNSPALPLHPRMLEIELDQRYSSWLDGFGELLCDDEIPSADELLDSLVDGDEGILEGLVLCLPDANYPDDDERPTLEKQYELLERTLPKLTNLTQLSIRGAGYAVDGYSGVAQRMALAIPRLRFINVRMGKHYKDGNFRRIVRGDQGEVTLVTLEGRMENEAVELYRMSSYERMSVHGP